MTQMTKDQPYMWRFMPLLSSGTMRWLLVAAASWLATLLGVPEALAGDHAERWVELTLQMVQGAAIMWAAYHRYAHPTPPLATTQKDADSKNASLVI